MKHAASVSVLSIIFLVTLLFGGCGNNSDQPSYQLNEHGMTGPAQLNIQSGDSLFLASADFPDAKLQLPADMSDSLIVAYSFVEPAESPDNIKTFTPGKMIHFSVDKNLTITVRINRNLPVGNTVQSLTGTIQDPHTGTITLSVNQNMLSGTIDVLSENRLFYLRYDRQSGRHYVAEIDRTKLDQEEGSQPLKLN